MVLAWWQIMLGVIVGLVILTILVIVHELGHAVVAKRNGVDVEEFGIGFPPRAKEFGKVKGTLVTLNWLPLGGFCKMKGENDDATGKGTYGAASLWAKAKILLAGVTMNFLLACLLFTILALFGIPRIMPRQFAIASDDHGERGVVGIYSVVKNSPAERAGLKKGDRLVSVAGKSVRLSSEVPLLTKQNAGRQADIVVIRDGKKRAIRAKIGDQDNSGRGRLGIQTTQLHAGTVRATWSAPIVGVITAGQFFRMTLSGLVGLIGNLFRGLWGLVVNSPAAQAELASVSDGVSGPVGILGQIFPSAMVAGPITLLYISGVISVSLAVMNLLPIPGLDGGRLYLTLWYRARHQKLTKEREEKIVGRGMAFLFGLIILITVVDLVKVFHK